MSAAQRPEPPPLIQSYIVRFCRKDSDQPARYSAQNVVDGVRLDFATFEELLAHFWQVVQEQPAGTTGVNDRP